MYYAGWSSSTGEADWALRPLFSTEAWPPKLNNTAYYSNQEVDALIAKALVTTSDAEKADLYAKAQELIVKDAPGRRSSSSRTSTPPPPACPACS